ncbi:CatB-related O-acetyltransferase [Modestobacter lapidis]|nr:CatB-related O-acetyltransferase [Modestobacter lapidis]
MGAELARGDLLWLGGTESAPRPESLWNLFQAALVSGDVVLAASEDPAPHAVVTAGTVPALRAAWLRDGASAGVDPVPAFVRQARSGSTTIRSVSGAGAQRVRIREWRQIGGHVQVPPGRFRVGPATYASPGTVVLTYFPPDEIEIGAYCSIANDVRLFLSTGRVLDDAGDELDVVIRGVHRPGSASTFPVGILVPDEAYDDAPAGSHGERLTIGDDVWIGYGAMVAGAVTVGTGAVIGAGAVVVADVPPYTVVGGVPARPIGRRFDEDTAGRLLRVAWWDWPEAVVRGAHRWFSRPVEEFLAHFDPAGELPSPEGSATSAG